MRRICVMGTGYVGLTSGACFAHLGHDVVCADVDTDKVARLSAGEVRTVEVGLGDLVAEGRTAGHLRFTDDVADAVAGAASATGLERRLFPAARATVGVRAR